MPVTGRPSPFSRRAVVRSCSFFPLKHSPPTFLADRPRGKSSFLAMRVQKVLKTFREISRPSLLLSALSPFTYPQICGRKDFFRDMNEAKNLVLLPKENMVRLRKRILESLLVLDHRLAFSSQDRRQREDKT